MVDTNKPKSTQKPYRRKVHKKRTYVPSPNQDTWPMCFRCNKPSHVAKYSRLNKKLRNLEIAEGILSQLSSLLVETSSNKEKASTKVELENNQMV